MRARYPDHTGEVVRDGLSIAFEVYENSGPTIVLLPTWSLVNSRHWKAQIPYLARHFRVVTYDGIGNGTQRPTDRFRRLRRRIASSMTRSPYSKQPIPNVHLSPGCQWAPP